MAAHDLDIKCSVTTELVTDWQIWLQRDSCQLILIRYINDDEIEAYHPGNGVIQKTFVTQMPWENFEYVWEL